MSLFLRISKKMYNFAAYFETLWQRLILVIHQ